MKVSRVEPLRAAVVLAAVALSFFTLYFGLQPFAFGPSPAILAAVLALSLSRASATASRATPGRASSSSGHGGPGGHGGLGGHGGPGGHGSARRAGMRRVALIPVVSVVATAVGFTLINAYPAGAALFTVVVAGSVYLRRWGPRATALGTLIALPFTAVLIVPVHLPSSLGPVTTAIVSVVAALVAIAWVETVQLAAHRLHLLTPTPTPPSGPPSRREGAAGSRGGRADGQRGALQVASTRMALQMAVALGSAFVVGGLLFPGHWGWVVLTAFIVCSGNRGRGDVAYKSVLRVAGAVGGTVAAVLVLDLAGALLPAKALGDIAGGAVLTALVFALLFAGVWLRGINYAFWAATVTIVLALLQTAATTSGGTASGTALEGGAVLGERIVAIVVGALCGAIASWFVLPVRTEAVVRRRVADALRALSEVVHPETAPDARAPALARFDEELGRVQQIAPAIRAHHRFTAVTHRAATVTRRATTRATAVTRRATAVTRRARTPREAGSAHQAEVVAQLLALRPMLEPFGDAEHPPSRSHLGPAARAVGAARRTLATPAPHGTAATLAALVGVGAALATPDTAPTIPDPAPAAPDMAPAAPDPAKATREGAVVRREAPPSITLDRLQNKGTRVTTPPRLVAFDLDDTLAPSKSPLDPAMAELLVRLLGSVEVCVISGGQIAQFTSQLIENLHGASDEALSHLHLMPTCGTQYYLYQNEAWNQIYAENLTDDEKAHALEVVERVARALGYWEPKTWGPILEDRGSQITFSALGQAAPVAEKMKWDPTGAKKNALREAAQAELPDLEVRSGGSTSVDITRRGIDKAYGMKKLADLTGIPLDDMLFVGDRLDPDGNDYPVKALGVECVAVEGWPDTAAFLEKLIPTLPPR